MSVASRFIAKILEEEELNIKPIIEEDGVTYIFAKHNNLYCIFLIHAINNAYLTIVQY